MLSLNAIRLRVTEARSNFQKHDTMIQIKTYNHLACRGLPVMNVQLCFSGGGNHCVVLIQVEVMIADGRNPSSHQKVTVPPSLVCE